MRETTTDTAPPDIGTKVQGQRVGPGPVSPHLRGEFTYSVIGIEPSTPPTPPPIAGKGADKRTAERLRTRLRAAHLSDHGDKVIVDCLIQDRSKSGARLRLALDRPLPKTFYLWDEVTKTRFCAQLAWQKGCDVGVKLISI